MLKNTPLTTRHYRLAVAAYVRRLDISYAAMHLDMKRTIYFFAGLTGEPTPNTTVRCESPWFETPLWNVYGIEVRVDNVPEYVLLFHSDGLKPRLRRDCLVACGPYDEAVVNAAAWMKAQGLRDPRVAYAKRLAAALEAMGDADVDEYMEVCRRGRCMVRVWLQMRKDKKQQILENKARWHAWRISVGGKTESFNPATGKTKLVTGRAPALAIKKRQEFIYRKRSRGHEVQDDGIYEPGKRGRPGRTVRGGDSAEEPGRPEHGESGG